jgi:ribonuclease III
LSGTEALGRLVASLPDELRSQALTHSSWAGHRTEAYGRLAFLGDSVLGMSIADELFRRFERSSIGRLTKVHGQTVSGRACVEVADALGLPGLLWEAAPDDTEVGISVDSLLNSERAMASIVEAMIGACYLENGYERTAKATVEAFEPQIQLATETLLDFKSALQEELAQRGATVSYEVVSEDGPPHDRRFEVKASARGEETGRGEGRSKKAAEQAAAAAALEHEAG